MRRSRVVQIDLVQNLRLWTRVSLEACMKHDSRAFQHVRLLLIIGKAGFLSSICRCLRTIECADDTA